VGLHNHPVAVEATVTATGEYGFAEAMEPVLASAVRGRIAIGSEGDTLRKSTRMR
jgi:hypothetical protein